MPAESQPRLRNASDRVLLDSMDRLLGPSVLLVLQNGTRLASELMKSAPDVRWEIFTFEHFLLTSLIDQMEQQGGDSPDISAELHCAPDLPDAAFDTVILPTRAGGAAELTRDLLQQAADSVKPNGRVLVSTDNPKDSWLHKQLKSVFGRVTVEKHKEGVCYIARRRPTPGKHKEFRAEFAFRDQERLIQCESRPGVFSHRKVDGGARSLIRSLDRLPADFHPQRIVDMGCGCGAVAVAAALRFPDAEVLAVDSSVRAIEATEGTAKRNGVTNLKVMLSCHAVLPDEGSWDLYLTNPPYYSDYRISELFLQSADVSLRRGGHLHLVTRLTDWHVDRMTEMYPDAQAESIGEYDVIMAKV